MAELTFIEDGNPTWRDGKVNFHHKCSEAHDTVKRALEHQKAHYSFTRDSEYLSRLHNSFTSSSIVTEKSKLTDLSSRLEKNETSRPPFNLETITKEQVIHELIELRDMSVLQHFDPNFVAKKTANLATIGANDFLQVKTDKLLHLLKRSPRGNPNNDRASLGTFSPTAGLQEIIAHMKMPGTGIRTKMHIDPCTRNTVEYFSPVDLVEWIKDNLGPTHAHQAFDVAKRLMDDFFIIGVDSEKILVEWRNNPWIKLTFSEKCGTVLMPALNTSENRVSVVVTPAGEEFTLEKLQEIAAKMKHPQSGLKIKTRKWLLKRFHKCFVGEQAVTWLCYHLDMPNRVDATKVGQLMVQNGIIQHVTKEHAFQDKYLFYEFAG